MLLKRKHILICLFAAVAMIAVLNVIPGGAYRSASTESHHILVIDPGHGGSDGGAVAGDGTLESEINLDIALKLEAIAAFWGTPTVMTRSSDAIQYPEGAESLSAKKKADQKARLELIRNTPGAVLVSIHQNYYPSASPCGIQVFFGTVEGSESLATICQNNLTSMLYPENRRVASPIDKNIYLLREADCPAVLVECGFLSNAEELTKLKDNIYRTELATAIFCSYMQYIEGTIS